MAVAAVGLGLLAALVYGDHVVRGGLLWDDWENAATTHLHYEPGFLGPLDLRQAEYRPVLQLLLPLPHLLFGSAAAPHLALALLLAVAAGAAFYGLLRALGAAREFGLAAAALALVFPWSDSTRLWATASINQVALVLVFAAGAISIRALRDGEPRARARATACMVAAGILTYEAVAGLVLLLPLLYALRAPWRVALRRWRLEAAAGGAAALLVAVATTKRTGDAGHVVAMARGGVELLGRALAPWGPIPPLAALGAALVAVAVRRSLARPAALSLAALVLAWAPFAPGEAKYVPGANGVYDRVNIVAGFAIAALVCSLAALTRARAAQLALVLAVGAGWVIHARVHVEEYSRAASIRDAELASVARAAPHPPAGTVIVLIHRADWAAPGVPVFGRAWDLGGALKLHYGDTSIGGYPLSPTTPVSCEKGALVVRTRGSDRPPPTPYGRALLVDAAAGVATRVGDARSCRAALRGRRGSA